MYISGASEDDSSLKKQTIKENILCLVSKLGRLYCQGSTSDTCVAKDKLSKLSVGVRHLKPSSLKTVTVTPTSLARMGYKSSLSTAAAAYLTGEWHAKGQ